MMEGFYANQQRLFRLRGSKRPTYKLIRKEYLNIGKKKEQEIVMRFLVVVVFFNRS